MGKVAKFGIGCLVVVALGIGALIFFAPRVWERAVSALENQSEGFLESLELAGGFVPPQDGNWETRDWPTSLVGEWSIVSEEKQLVKTSSLVDENWSSRMYQLAQEGEEEVSVITIHLRPADEATQAEISEAVKTFELPNNTEQLSIELGSRISRIVSNQNTTRCYELWTLGQEKDWLMLVEGADEGKVKDGAIQFLESLKPEAGYLRR